MLDLVILVFLIIGFFVGLKRGFILQAIHLAGFFVAFIIAYMYYDELAPKIALWVPYPAFGDDSAFKMFFDSTNLEDVYYRAIAFVVIFFAVKIALHLLGSMLDFLSHLPVVRTLNVWAGGALGFLEVYLIIFIILFIAALLPIEGIQGPLNDSVLAKIIVEYTPFFSDQIKDIWFEHMA